MYRPSAMSRAPFLDIARSHSSLLSVNVTPLRSIMQARLSWLLCALFWAVLSSLTQGPTKRPCAIHLVPVAMSIMVILSTATSRASDATSGLVSHLASVPTTIREATRMPEPGVFR